MAWRVSPITVACSCKRSWRRSQGSIALPPLCTRRNIRLYMCTSHSELNVRAVRAGNRTPISISISDIFTYPYVKYAHEKFLAVFQGVFSCDRHLYIRYGPPSPCTALYTNFTSVSSLLYNSPYENVIQTRHLVRHPHDLLHLVCTGAPTSRRSVPNAVKN